MRLLLLFLFCIVSSLLFAQDDYTPPVAKKLPKTDTIHGKILTDNYFWLREKTNTDVINHLYAENAYADNMMKDTRMLQKKIYEEMRGRIQENYVDLPVKRDSFYYYFRYEKDKNYPIHCRKKHNLEAPEEIILDQNELAKNFLFFSLRLLSVSPDHKLLMYGVDTKGDNVVRIFFKDLVNDSVINDEIPSALSAVWANDNKTIFYLVPEAKTKRAHKLIRHELGTELTNDVMVMEEKDITFNMNLGRSTSKKFIFLSISKTKSSEYHFLDAEKPHDDFRLIEPREHEHNYSVNHFTDDEFLISTNWKALNNRIMKAPVANPSRNSWKEVIPHNSKVLNLGAEQYKDYMVIGEKENAFTRVRIISNDKKEDYYLQFTDTLVSTSWERAYEFEDNKIRVSYQSMIKPETIFDYDLKTKQRTQLYTDTIVGGYKISDYVTERIYATAADGKLIPITIAYKKGLVKNGNNPVFLTSYGSYGSGSLPTFSKAYLSYLNRGFIYAIAHIRGGDDMGRQWYEEGKLLNKKNTFTDFIAAAEHLIKENYTNSSKLSIEGGSAGGLLMGAVVNMRPDLFKAVVAAVPFVDVINTMLDETLPLTTFEYEEWGDPRKQEYFNYMYSYSPYDNVEAKNYPAIYARAGYNDAQVGYWEPAKWVAKLREMKTDTNLLLFKTVMEGGHGGVSGRYEGLKQLAFEMAFIMKALGIKENYIEVKGKVVDSFNSAIPYANVIIAGTTKGTTTNDEGEFTITLKEGEPQQLLVQSIGYKKHIENITMNTRVNELKIKLESEHMQLREAVISANAKDPAYAIIKKAIDNRKYNLERVASLSADIYIKSTVRLNKIPDKLPKFISKADLPDSNDIGLMYLSESVARYHYMQPENEKEEMLSSKVGGMGKGYSWNRASDVRFNFYENTIPISYYSDRPFISPISATAMLYYKYRFDGSFFLDGHQVNKIEVIPRRKGDPAFNGYIFIAEDGWQIHSLDLHLTKDAQIEFVDTLFIKEEYVAVQDSIWMPLSVKMTSRIKVFGFDATDMTLGFFTNYNLNRSFPPKFFKNEVFKIEAEANKKDTAYWQETRPFLLTPEENKYYTKEDSMEAIKNSPAYKDSVFQKRNRLTVGKILIGGYTRYLDGYNKRIYVSPLTDGISFNTVEGLVTQLRGGYTISPEGTYKSSAIGGRLRYGFSNKHFNAMGIYSRRYNAKRLATYKVSCGKYVFQLNENQPISTWQNTFYTLAYERNYAKLFEKAFFKFENLVEITNGLVNNTTLEYATRYALNNTSNFKLRDVKNREYTSNNPVGAGDNAKAFSTHDVVTIGLDFIYRHKQKYESYPNRKIILGSDYPELYFSYKKGFALTGATFNYDYISGGIGDDIDLKTFGKFKFDVTAGTFFNKSGMNFIDYKHFEGSRVLFLRPAPEYDWFNQGRSRLTAFHTLNYYSHSTNNSFLEIHAHQHFKGFWLSKFPLIRKLKWQEIVGINGAYTTDRHFTELFVGIDNIFKILRVDFASYYTKGQKIKPELRIGLGLSF